jgi:hypothetical protein
MKRISLIANTGIQYYRFRTNIDRDSAKKSKIHFFEKWADDEDDYVPYILFQVNDNDGERLFLKQTLIQKGFIGANGNLLPDVDLSELKAFDTETHKNYETDGINRIIKSFENNWIPIPLFKNNYITDPEFGPVDWARIFIKSTDSQDYKEIIIAIDTSCSKSLDRKISPLLNDNPDENIFSLCTSEEMLSNYLSKHHDCKWVDDTIKFIYYSKQKELQEQRPFTRYAAEYISFIKWLSTIIDFPEVQIYGENTEPIGVDLVIDVGNSKTCALLFENPDETKIDFTKAKYLNLQNQSNPFIVHSESFSMNLVFKEFDLAKIPSENYHNNKFKYGSMLRIGPEAEWLMSKSSLDLSIGRELNTFNSSPKRYLWDSSPSSAPWDFYPQKQPYTTQYVFVPGISEQLKVDGSLRKNEADSVFGTTPNFSRKSLMSLVFLEIMNQANRQINSFEFRQEHGNLVKPRRINRIIASCPTGMIQEEQLFLRQSIVEGCTMHERFKDFAKTGKLDLNAKVYTPDVVPTVADLKLSMEDWERKRDWMYDEATSCQLVYLNALISHKFDNNLTLAFESISGKAISGTKKTITVGSVDMGAGTTDLMICKYVGEEKDMNEVVADPLFWESFKLAGDDLVKEIIQQVILEGEITNDSDNDCKGVISNHAKKSGIHNIQALLNSFVGIDSNHIGHKGKMTRKLFMHQIALPIAYKYLEHAKENKDDIVIGYSEIFDFNQPSKSILDSFNKHFGFPFEDLKWRLSKKRVYEISHGIFEPLVKQISLLLSNYNCDVVVLSGRPFGLESLENLFLKYYSVNPSKLINLNNYWIGKWYPFADQNGFIKDPKSIVAVGCLIAAMSSNLNRNKGFKLNTELLKRKLVSTADNIYVKKDSRETKILDKRKNEAEITITQIPTILTYKRIDSKNYPSSTLISINFNDQFINDHRVVPNDNSKSLSAIKSNIMTKLPLKIFISREMESSKEKLIIENIENIDGNTVEKNLFRLQWQTLGETGVHWLDSGEFYLNIN